MTTDAALHVAERYARFARDEAPGRSALYERWAAGVAGDRQMQALLARVPAHRRQPPLVFAVTRMLGAPEEDYGVWAQWVRMHVDRVVAECARRSIQTNEPLRCAALLPALALVPGPIALLEVGVSAGICLYPDRYAYRYDTADGEVAVRPADGPAPLVLRAASDGDPLPPLALPDVVWRAGIDLAPLNAADPDDRAFLTALVWPGEEGRAARIEAALDVVAADPPQLVAGDATDPRVLGALAAAAPREATLVITTPGVLPHISREGRQRLIAAIAELPGRWISIDPPGWHAPQHPASPTWEGFVLSVDGMPRAEVDPLGASVRWRASRR